MTSDSTPGSCAAALMNVSSSATVNASGHHAASGVRADHVAGAATALGASGSTASDSLATDSSATRQGMIVMPGGGGGKVIAPPSPTEPTFALVVFTLADTNLKNARNASGDMSRIWITVSVVSRNAARSA